MRLPLLALCALAALASLPAGASAPLEGLALRPTFRAPQPVGDWPSPFEVAASSPLSALPDIAGLTPDLSAVRATLVRLTEGVVQGSRPEHSRLLLGGDMFRPGVEITTAAPDSTSSKPVLSGHAVRFVGLQRDPGANRRKDLVVFEVISARQPNSAQLLQISLEEMQP